MNQQQEEIKKKLLALIEKDRKSKRLSVRLISDERARSGSVLSELVCRNGDMVLMVLSDPGFDEQKLALWDSAILQANELLDLIAQEKIHDYNNPNFFKAMQAIVPDYEKEITIDF